MEDIPFPCRMYTSRRGKLKLKKMASDHNILLMFEVEHSFQLPNLPRYSHAKRWAVLLGLYDSIVNKIVEFMLTILS